MIVFLLEEPSMEALLKEILPKIIKNDSFFLVPHEGKDNLLKSIPIKLKAWNMPDTRFVIVHDQDNNDCIDLKNRINELCKPYNKEVLVRIVCKELESWYLGDIQAVEKAYGKNLSKIRNSSKYRVPDDIANPKELLKKWVPELTQIDGASRISKYMVIENNTSHSFRVFIDGVRRMCNSRL